MSNIQKMLCRIDQQGRWITEMDTKFPAIFICFTVFITPEVRLLSKM